MRWRGKLLYVETTEGLGADHGKPLPDTLSLSGALLVVAISFAGVAQGGFYRDQFRILIGILLTALVAALLSGGRRRVAFWHPPVMTAVALSASAAVSAGVAGNVADALPAVGLLAGMGVTTVVVHRAGPTERQLLLTAVVVVGALIALSGWAGVVFRLEPLAQVHQGLWRAASTITYPNATAGFLLLPALLALGHAVHERTRELWSLASYCLVVGILATLSRAGVLALGAGVAVLGVMSCSPRRAAAALWPVGVGAGVAAAGFLLATPARVPSRPGLSVAAFGVGAALAVLAPRARRQALALLLVASAPVAIAFGMHYLPPVAEDITAVRLTTASSDRINSWTAALRLSARRPLLGTGTGNAVIEYRSKDGNLLNSRYVHNEYLQLLAEQGVVGVVVLVVGMVFTGRWVARTLKNLPNSTRAGGVAGLTALGLHSAGDFLWHVPVIPVTTAVILGLLTAHGEDGGGNLF